MHQRRLGAATQDTAKDEEKASSPNSSSSSRSPSPQQPLRQNSRSPQILRPDFKQQIGSSRSSSSRSSKSATEEDHPTVDYDELERGENKRLLVGSEKDENYHHHASSAYQPLAHTANTTAPTIADEEGQQQGFELRARSKYPNQMRHTKDDSSTTASVDQRTLLSRHQRGKRSFWEWLTGKRIEQARLITLNEQVATATPYPPNIIRNQKYNFVTFIPIVLYNQFKFFFNLYFLLVCLSQLVPMLRVTFLFTNIAPLVLVLAITISKEAYDDYKRYLRDSEANSQQYARLLFDGHFAMTPSSALQVGDVVMVNRDERVPADLVLLRTSDRSGGTFIRTDQLDGETDWKLRLAVPSCQKLSSDAMLFDPNTPIEAHVDAPQKDIHSFLGTFRHGTEHEPLGLEHTLWMNTIVAGHPALGIVIYTGPDTRAVMNTSRPHTKIGLVEQELNGLTKMLCLIVVGLALGLVAMKGFYGLWPIYFVRFVVLFSTIIPLR